MHDMAALQGKEQSWHDLAGHYGLDDMMSATSEQDHRIEEEFESYGNGPLTHCLAQIL